jgi:hypothetical protein
MANVNYLKELRQGGTFGGAAPDPLAAPGGLPGAGINPDMGLPPVGPQQPPPGTMGAPTAPPGGMPPQPGSMPPGLDPNAPGIAGAPTTPQTPAPGGQDQMLMDLYSRLGALQPQEKAAGRQRALADQLRGGARMPGMRAGQAAHPLEFLSSLGHAGAAAYKGSQADTAEDELAKERAGAFGEFRKGQGFAGLPNKPTVVNEPAPGMLDKLRSGLGF